MSGGIEEEGGTEGTVRSGAEQEVRVQETDNWYMFRGFPQTTSTGQKKRGLPRDANEKELELLPDPEKAEGTHYNYMEFLKSGGFMIKYFEKVVSPVADPIQYNRDGFPAEEGPTYRASYKWRLIRIEKKRDGDF